MNYSIDNLTSWETFEAQTVECHRQLDNADQEFTSIKKIFDLSNGPSDYNNRKVTAANFRTTIEGLFNAVNDCNNIIQQMLPEDKKKDMSDQVNDIQKRMEVLKKTDEKLDFIDDFNKRLAVFNTAVSDLESWLLDGRKRIDTIIAPTADLSPEDRVTKTMEVQEDLRKKSEFTGKQEAEKEAIFPKADEKVPSDAKKFIARLEKVRKTINSLEDEVKAECAKFSEDVKFWAEFQTGIKEFEPWIKNAEIRKKKGLVKPTTLVEACQVLGDSKVRLIANFRPIFKVHFYQNFQEECEGKLKVLEEAEGSAKKMSCHNEADGKVSTLKVSPIKVVILPFYDLMFENRKDGHLSMKHPRSGWQE